MILDRFHNVITRLGRDEDGSALVEFGLIICLMLFLIFGLIDFGRLGFSYVMAQKATERAVREAVVRTPVCATLPLTNTRNAASAALTQFGFGSQCSANASLCTAHASVSCTAANGSAVGQEIFTQIQALLPTNATPQNLQFSYEFTSDFGFLGGPYTPLVTVEIRDLEFEFVTPIGALGAIVGANQSGEQGEAFGFPSMSNSLPAEILSDGESA